MSQLLVKNFLPPGEAFRLVKVPGSKSVCNRVLVIAALAKGESRLEGGLEAEDTQRMRECLGRLGVPVREAEGAWILQGGTSLSAPDALPVGASGTTLRFLLPWLALRAPAPVRFQGEARLFERPLGGLLDPLRALGATWDLLPDGGVLGPIPSPPGRIDLQLDPSESSQFLTGLALAAAGLPEGGHFTWKRPPVSRSYLDLTVGWLEAFGCRSNLSTQGWEIPGGRLEPRSVRIPGDWSGAAAFLCAAAVTGCRVRVAPLDPEDPQGDRALTAILEAAGCRVTWEGPRELQVQGPLRRGLQADLTRCPDLGPVLAATAALAPSPSVLTGLETLPLKECDRLEASADLVRWLGGTAEVVAGHSLRISPGDCPIDRRPFDPRNDHRMAFAAAVGALRCGGQLENSGCVAKTFPTFWEDWSSMLGTAP